MKFWKNYIVFALILTTGIAAVPTLSFAFGPQITCSKALGGCEQRSTSQQRSLTPFSRNRTKTTTNKDVVLQVNADRPSSFRYGTGGRTPVTGASKVATAQTATRSSTGGIAATPQSGVILLVGQANIIDTTTPVISSSQPSRSYTGGVAVSQPSTEQSAPAADIGVILIQTK